MDKVGAGDLKVDGWMEGGERRMNEVLVCGREGPDGEGRRGGGGKR